MNAERRGFSLQETFRVVLLLAVALAAAVPLWWGPGIVNTRGGGDSPFLLQRVHQMAVNLRAGVFPVRWMPDAAYGLGYPFYSYYAALPYYLAGLLTLLGADILTSVQLTQTLGFLLAAWAMYGWMRLRARSPWAAWLAAVGYTAAPFHLVNVYVRGDSLSEFYAFVFYPLVLWALDLPAGRPFRRAAVALVYAGLLLTHNISALIFTPFVLLYTLMRHRPNRGMLRDLGALGLGLALAAWFWFPALAESPLVQLGPVTEGYFHYTNHFRGWNLVQDSFGFDYSLTSPGRTPFAMGLAQAIGAGVGTLSLLAWTILFQKTTKDTKGPKKSEKSLRSLRVALFGLAGLLISTLMVTPLSKPLWDHLPLLPMVQFPWRFLSVQALFAAAVLGLGVDVWLVGRPRVLIPASLLAGAALTLAVLVPLRPDRLSISPGDVSRERLLLYELFTGNIGTTIRHEYLYQAVVPRPFTSDAVVEPDAPPRAIPLDGARLEATQVFSAPTRQVWRVSGEGGSIAFPILYWPGWRGSVDGQPVKVGPVEGSGYLFLQVSPGEHTVVLWLGRTGIRAAAEGLSLATVLGVLALLMRGRLTLTSVGADWKSVLLGRLCASRRPWPTEGSQPAQADLRPKAPTRPTSVGAPILLLFVLGAFGLLVARSALFRPPVADQNPNMDFIQMPYLHSQPQGVRFEGPDGWAELLEYTLSGAILSPGDPLTATLKMETSFSPTVTLELVSPAAVRYDLTPLAKADCDFHLCSLTVPPDTPRGLYLLRLRLFGPTGELTPRTPAGLERGLLYLAPVRVIAGPPLSPEAPVLAAFGPGIRLHGATVAQASPDRLSVRLAWSARFPIAANYGISLRLRDSAGRDVQVMDTQPGYGFLPTSMWRPGEMVTDRYDFPLPLGLACGDPYTLQVVLYRFPSLQAVGAYTVGPFSLPLEEPYHEKPMLRVFSLPPISYPMDVNFGGEIRLAGYDLAREGDRLALTLYWQALVSPRADYTRFVHLFDPTTGAPVVQSDTPPREGKYPTSWWVTGEVVSETVFLSLTEVPPGVYRLGVGWYEHRNPGTPEAVILPLPALGPDGQRFPDDRAPLPTEVRK
ncbi:MAG: 6-pyruvoyl-tetrahydropterin synthase-related protein [Anaerolineae bacterium]|nr:6-pyruvoyl-tetrahydropterin synthase-related protein [Anaerolineae bacterium]